MPTDANGTFSFPITLWLPISEKTSKTKIAATTASAASERSRIKKVLIYREVILPGFIPVFQQDFPAAATSVFRYSFDARRRTWWEKSAAFSKKSRRNPKQVTPGEETMRRMARSARFRV
jgi:hypothetical protein